MILKIHVGWLGTENNINAIAYLYILERFWCTSPENMVSLKYLSDLVLVHRVEAHYILLQLACK
jgi:hypothetical protein